MKQYSFSKKIASSGITAALLAIALTGCGKRLSGAANNAAATTTQTQIGPYEIANWSLTEQPLAFTWDTAPTLEADFNVDACNYDSDDIPDADCQPFVVIICAGQIVCKALDPATMTERTAYHLTMDTMSWGAKRFRYTDSLYDVVSSDSNRDYQRAIGDHQTLKVSLRRYLVN